MTGVSSIHSGGNAGLSALILGGTGAAGSRLLQDLLASPRFVRVGEYGRRVTPLAHIAAASRDKLEQRVIDFEHLEKSGLRDGHWDVVFIALGMSSFKSGSWAEFEKVDRELSTEYVVNAARAAKTDDPNHAQRLVYISSIWANPTCYFPYFRSKGRTEQQLAALSYRELVVFRPGGFGEVHRDPPRHFEHAMRIIFGTLWRVTGNPHVHIPVSRLARAMRIAGEVGSYGLRAYAPLHAGPQHPAFTAFSNCDALALSETFRQI